MKFKKVVLGLKLLTCLIVQISFDSNYNYIYILYNSISLYTHTHFSIKVKFIKISRFKFSKL